MRPNHKFFKLSSSLDNQIGRVTEKQTLAKILSIAQLFIKAAVFNFAVENDARKTVETFFYLKINIVGYNFQTQNVLFPNFQSA